MKTALLILSAALLSGCSATGKLKSEGIKITDTFQREVTIEENPQRIVSASPSITEILFALKQEKKLVGRTDYCTYPPEVKTIPSIGTITNPNLESLASFRPDLVIASTHFKKEVAEKIDLMRIPIVVLKNQETFEGAYDVIRQTAEIVDAEEAGDSIIQKMQQDVSDVVSRVKTITERPSVYYVIGFGKSGEFTAGGNTFIGKMINMAGGTNIAEEITGWSYSLEKLIQMNPEIILIRKGKKKLFMSSPSYQSLKAVKNNQVYEVDNRLFDLAGPRLSEGLKTLFNILHPIKK